MIFDTHAHYDDRRYDEDREAVLASLSTFGVTRVTNISAEMQDLEPVLQLAKKQDFMYATLGVHPDYTEYLTDKDMETLEKLAEENSILGDGSRKVVAIGECGLDYYGDESVPKEVQKKWMIRQIEIAKKLNLPVIIHSRDAAEDTYEILKAHPIKDGMGVVHCFSYPKEMAKKFLDLGYYIALGGVVTFKNGRHAKEVAAMVPEDRLLIETDCPYLAPVPHRGERNFSGYLPEVVKAIAEIRNVSPDEVERFTYENALKFYQIKE